jgi:hypothetical protein
VSLHYEVEILGMLIYLVKQSTASFAVTRQTEQGIRLRLSNGPLPSTLKICNLRVGDCGERLSARYCLRSLARMPSAAHSVQTVPQSVASGY